MVARGESNHRHADFQAAPNPPYRNPESPKGLNSHRSAGTKLGPGGARLVPGGCVLVAGDQPFFPWPQSGYFRFARAFFYSDIFGSTFDFALSAVPRQHRLQRDRTCPLGNRRPDMLAPSARLPLRSRGSVAGLAFHAPGTGSGATRNSSAPTGTTTLQVPNRGAARSGGRGMNRTSAYLCCFRVASGRRGARVRLRNWVSGMVTAWLALPLLCHPRIAFHGESRGTTLGGCVRRVTRAKPRSAQPRQDIGFAWMDQTEVKPRIVIFDLTARKPRRIVHVPDRTKLRVSME